MATKGYHQYRGRGRGGNPLPSAHILRLFRDMGGEVVTIGSDAHVPQHIGMAVPQCQQLLRETGWQYFATFAQGKPIFHPL